MTTTYNDFGYTDLIKSYLDSDEKILWSDKPSKGLIFSKADWFLIPFGLFFLGFSIFWISMALTLTDDGGPRFFALFGIPFVIMGYYITFGRHIHDVRKRSKLIYYLTSNRVIIFNRQSSRSHSYSLEQLIDITYSTHSEGSGNLYLGALDARFEILQGTSWPGVKQPPMFVNVPNVQRVFSQLIEGRKKRLEFLKY